MHQESETEASGSTQNTRSHEWANGVLVRNAMQSLYSMDRAFTCYSHSHIKKYPLKYVRVTSSECKARLGEPVYKMKLFHNVNKWKLRGLDGSIDTIDIFWCYRAPINIDLGGYVVADGILSRFIILEMDRSDKLSVALSLLPYPLMHCTNWTIKITLPINFLFKWGSSYEKAIHRCLCFEKSLDLSQFWAISIELRNPYFIFSLIHLFIDRILRLSQSKLVYRSIVHR